MTPDPPAGTQAIQRSLALLSELAGAGAALPLGELSERAGLPKPTVHRILGALESEGLVARGERDGTYRLGEGLVELGAQAQLGRQRSHPAIPPFLLAGAAHLDGFAFRDWSGSAAVSHYRDGHEPEYYALRGAAGLIDVSPLFKLEIAGPQAEELMNRVLTRDVRKCRVGQVVYSCWCDDGGYLRQDGNVIRLERNRFLLTSVYPDLRWVMDCGEGLDAAVRDVTDDLAALALQGPRARAVLEAASGVALGGLAYFRSRSLELGGVEVTVSRTGYTGDLGYEIWIPRARSRAVWDALSSAGEGHGLVPCGLAAMDVSRVEAGLVLADVDFVPSHLALMEKRRSTPHEAGLGWTVKLVDGNDFVGRAAIEEELRRGVHWTVAGVEIGWLELDRLFGEQDLRPTVAGQPVCREPAELRVDGRVVGHVTSQVFSPMLKRHIGLATLPPELAVAGRPVEMELRVDRDRVWARGRIAALPFFDPPRKRAVDATGDAS